MTISASIRGTYTNCTWATKREHTGPNGIETSIKAHTTRVHSERASTSIA